MSTVSVATEVESIHQFIQRWFNGAVPKTSEAFARLSSAWPEGFTLVDPHNERRSSPELLESTYQLHGQFPNLIIQVKNITVNHTKPFTAVATYEEWHVEPGEVEARLCSATFTFEASRSEHPLWLHIHESRLTALGTAL